MFWAMMRPPSGALLASFELTINSNVTNWNLIDEIGFTPSYPVEVTITVNSGKVVRSTSTSTAAMDLTGLASGSEIALINNGIIHGRGGRGGDGGTGSAAGSNGGTGGPAIDGPGAGVSLTITNGSGTIFGGGGGGGGGGGSRESVETSPGEFETMSAGGGGGGGGAGGSSVSSGGASSGDGATNGSSGAAGTTGGSGAGGNGGNNGTVPSVCSGGDGGDGGEYGQAGSSGAAGSSGDVNTAGGSGGAAGKAIDLNGGSAPTWVSGNTAARVKGAVS